MSKYFNELITKYPKRRKQQEKDLFIDYIKEIATNHQLNFEVEEIKNNKNIIVGDLKNSDIIYTAHYDTPATSIIPNLMMPRNPILSMMYSIGFFILMAFISLAIAYGICLLLKINLKYAFIIYLFLYFLFFLFGFKTFDNKFNYNDNTSGIATILDMIDNKPNIAFILFDNEEKGLLGSKAFSKKHSELTNKLFVNLDCVGNGDHFLLISQCENINNEKLNQYLQNVKNNFDSLNNHKYQILFFPKQGSVCNSDHRNFKNSIGVVACKKGKLIKYYASKIHTNRDKVCDVENLEFLSKIL